MSREIKFRAWDKHNKKMYYSVGINSNGKVFSTDIMHNFSIPYESVKDCFDKMDKLNFELMQYTGLKDKNGKEIYGGDIIKFHYVDDYVSEVEFRNCEFGVEFEYNGTREFHNLFEVLGSESIEVIDTIYENPELLKGGDYDVVYFHTKF